MIADLFWSLVLVALLLWVAYLALLVAALRVEQRRTFRVIDRLQVETMNLRDELSVRRDPPPFKHRKPIHSVDVPPRRPDDPGPRRDLPNIYEDWPQ